MPWPKGQPKSAATREKIRQAKLGKPPSDEARAAISRAVIAFWAEFRASGRVKRGTPRSSQRRRADSAVEAQAALEEPVGVVQEPP
jgi:hypothetical protein